MVQRASMGIDLVELLFYNNCKSPYKRIKFLEILFGELRQYLVNKTSGICITL